MGDALNPSVMSRLIHEWRPDWTRTVAARRMAAAALVVLAAVAAFRSDPHGDQTDVVVAARDLSPGIELTAADLRVEKRLAATIPDGSRDTLDDVVGSTLAGPARRGEVLTDVRLLGPRLAQSAAGPDARIVPLHLADTALLDLVRPGDVVDVLAAADDDADPRVVATDAVVVLVSEKQKGPGAGGDRVLLVALPALAANDVAGATLMQTVTLTFH
ncbi:flagellar biosynthesis protein FlgA [Mycobacteriaceae bacterium 1482268.1]|nr:flagellar biosynthesis protein FlgA [Mycobacteriaceae bacterium 1482268.1]